MSILFGIVAITLIIVSEMLSSYYGKGNIRLNKRRLRMAALATSAIFLVTIAIKVIDVIIKTLAA
jgi:ABC-type nitrate/sulfonate/bicarbonate transport system permease component